jgi:sulfite reductase alpha subunit-like flavoprotein
MNHRLLTTTGLRGAARPGLEPGRLGHVLANELLALRDGHPNFRYLPAISRENNVIDGVSHDTMYVQDRIRTNADELRAQLVSEKNLIYVCGVAGMELGIFQELAKTLAGDSLEQYLQVEREALADIGN